MIKYICVQPRLVYYVWQLEVMINNFIKNGIQQKDINILLAYSPNQADVTNDSNVVDLYQKLMARFIDVNFFFYKDTRHNPFYISSVRPNILKQHFKLYPELKAHTFFYHDCDMIFSKPPDFQRFLNDKIWYLSNTNSYINYSYIISKGENIYKSMCRIIGIDEKIPKLFNSNSGGSQYIMKDLTFDFWEKVEKDSETLYLYFLQQEKLSNVDNPIQKWTSDMWAVLWNAWFFEKETKVDPYLDFTWATDQIQKWDINVIYHNAGVISEEQCFYKGNYINSIPYSIENKYSPLFASYKYVEEILTTKEGSLLLTNT